MLAAFKVNEGDSKRDKVKGPITYLNCLFAEGCTKMWFPLTAVRVQGSCLGK